MDTVASILSPLHLYYLGLYFNLKYELDILRNLLYQRVFCCTVVGYSEADVFGRCTDSNRLRAHDERANAASQLILVDQQRNCSLM